MIALNKKLIKDIIQWDVNNWTIPLNYWEKILDNEKSKLTCLELGGREGGLSLWLALNGHQVITSDLKNTEQTARPLHDKYSFDGKIIYMDIDATAIPFENYFDLIIFKSILGGIGYNNNKASQQELFKQIYKALRPGGKLLYAENIRSTKLHSFFRAKFTRWGKSWRYVTINELKYFMSEFKSCEIKSTGFIGAFGVSEGQKGFLGHADKLLLNFLFPSNWKYIGYGYAVK